MSDTKYPLCAAIGLEIVRGIGMGSEFSYIRASDLEQHLSLHQWRDENGEESIRFLLPKEDTAESLLKEIVSAYDHAPGNFDEMLITSALDSLLIKRAKQLLEANDEQKGK